MSDEFGELRALLERRPSAAVFDVLAQRLEGAVAEQEEMVRQSWLPYVEDKLSGWPDVERLCPKHRLEDYESGEPIWAHLVRALDYEGVSIKKSRLAQILDAPDASKIKHLDIRSANLKWAQIGKLVDEAPFELESFGFRRVSAIDWDVLDAMFASKMLSGVKRLNLRGWDKIKADVYAHMIAHFPLENLLALDVSGGAMSSRKLKELLQTGRLDQLEDFRAEAWVSDKTTNGMIGVLAKHEGLENLHTLKIREAKSRELDLLANAGHLSSLRVLEVLRIDDDMPVGRAIQSEHLENVEDLSLYSQPKHWATNLDALTSAPMLERLHSLKFRGEQAEQGAPVLERFLKSGRVGRIRRLAMKFDAAMIDLLCEHADAMPQLEELHLDMKGDRERLVQSMSRLFSTVHFPKLHALRICAYGYVKEDQALMEAVLDKIDDTVQLARIESLRMEAATAKTMANFLTRANLSELRELDLSDLGYMDDAVVYPALLSSTRLSRLESAITDTSYRANNLLAQMVETEHELSEFIHVSYPEYAMFQRDDWMS